MADHPNIQIFATDQSGARKEIKDLYWFEEQGVHDLAGEGSHGTYTFEIFVDGVKVFASPPKIKCPDCDGTGESSNYMVTFNHKAAMACARCMGTGTLFE